MKKISLVLLLSLTLGLLAATAVFAQTEELHLSMSRDWGYSSGSGDIQGLFSMKVSGSDSLARVEFYIDETMIGGSTQTPFKLQFTTDDYPTGIHTLYAIGYTPTGDQLRTQTVTVNFVSADEGWQSATKIIIPMAVVLLAAILLSVVVPALTTRGKHQNLPLGEERKYGINGGGICPKCKRPFVMHIWGMNLGLSRLDRCPYCGKWSVVRIQSLAKLRQAEKAELDWGKGEVKEETEEERLRKDLDNSKYQ